jgi:uncharacterized membrane protein affecting hemolysin expression
MSPEAHAFRGLIIRAVTGERPALIVSVADSERLNAVCEQLARAERVADLFAHKGYSKPGDPIDKTAASLPLPYRKP